MKKFILLSSLFSTSAFSIDLPNFIDKNEINNAEFKCLTTQPNYTPEEMKLVNLLWDESIKYLEGYVKAITTSTDSQCLNSAISVIETNTPQLTGPTRQCIMDNVDMQRLVKHVYTVINNKDKAFKCFTPQKNAKELYSPSEQLKQASPVAQWLNRPSLKDYYSSISNDSLKMAGIRFYNNFYKMVTGKAIKMPTSFPYDISATNLPNLWASVGWVPLYSNNKEHSINAGEEAFRGGYAYGEIMGHWGLLQIDTINGEPVGAEIGMTVQAMDSFYPYHFHNNPEIYYTIREPRCLNSIQQFIIGKNNKLFNVINENSNSRTLEFNGATTMNVSHYWLSTTPTKDELLYIPRNSIHAFNLKENCEINPQESAHVTVWARSMSHEKIMTMVQH
ncbi:dimethylsulfonioproprionate lyase family protein [Xenorhabdus stockiae]|uniref:dimethylsulfonioproprionate lyase family protein n=1 Tax=Xenorhabdus stockiae TaxID=351614 RepID=UPI003CF434DE